MIRKSRFIIREIGLRVGYIMSKDCIFCKIVAGEIKSKPVLENEVVLAFNDINPVCETHILIIPKRHINSVVNVGKSESEEIISMFGAARELSVKKKIDSFRLSFNAGKYQHVPHLHMHFLAGRKIDWGKL